MQVVSNRILYTNFYTDKTSFCYTCICMYLSFLNIMCLCIEKTNGLFCNCNIYIVIFLLLLQTTLPLKTVEIKKSDTKKKLDYQIEYQQHAISRKMPVKCLYHIQSLNSFQGLFQKLPHNCMSCLSQNLFMTDFL